jgi:hypothetical protein
VSDLTTVVLPAASPTEQLAQDEDPSAPAVGRWYWVAGKQERWLGCVVHLGSNYARLKGIRWARRIHQNEFDELCTFEPDPQTVINGHVGMHQERVKVLMDEIREVTMRLGVGANPLLTTGSETQAMTLRRDEPMDTYKTALVKAKDETLPELFQRIHDEHAALARWMKAPLIPMKAQAGSLKPAIKSIEDRIFSVQLYAGLVEEIVRITDGEPAPMTAKIHLFQRRAYMDEECLAAYETGGMEFKNIGDFDKWMAKRANRDRLLPFPRCILAFQVRRNRKERYAETYADYVHIARLEQMDKFTYLYMRNGDRLFRLATEIEFEHRLFPNADEHENYSGKLWVHTSWDGHCESDDSNDHDDTLGDHIRSLVPDRQYQGMLEDDERAFVEWRDVKVPDAQKKINENKKLPKKDRDPFLCIPSEPRREAPNYTVFDRTNVFYDDITNYIQRQIVAHNRLVLVLQGLLDRSPVMHPHPPWVLWNEASFHQAIEPIYDLGKALVDGEAPDFEAYRAACNESIKEGTITFGQEHMWRKTRRGEDDGGYYSHYSRGSRRPGRYRDVTDPGPGKFARVARVGRGGACVFEWVRVHIFWKDHERIERKLATKIRVKRDALFNVEAYKLGDFKKFFGDPRTRENYLKWAPILLEAEEYHAGNRKVRKPEVMPKPKARTPGGSYEYQTRKRKMALVGQACALVRDVTVRSKKVYKKGTLWRISYLERGNFSVYGIKKNGTQDDADVDGSVRAISNLSEYEFSIRSEIPPKPKKSE